MKHQSPSPLAASIIADFRGGMSPRRIATKRSMRLEGVRWHLRRWLPGEVQKRFRRIQYDGHVRRYAEAAAKLRRRIDRNNAIVAALRTGTSYREVAELLAVSYETVRIVAHKNGFPKLRACTRQRDADWFALSEQGMTVREIADRYGKPWSTVREGVARARDGYVFRERMVCH